MIDSYWHWYKKKIFIELKHETKNSSIKRPEKQCGKVFEILIGSSFDDGLVSVSRITTGKYHF